MATLQDLTGQESGVVVYGREGIICNWSSINGLPRMFVTGLLGLGEIGLESIGEVPLAEITPKPIEDIGAALEEVFIIYGDDADADSLIGTPGRVWEFPDPSTKDTTVRVYAPDGWN